MFPLFDIFMKFMFSKSNIIFPPFEFSKTRNQYRLMRRSLHLCFYSISKILKTLNFVIFHHFWGQSRVLFGFFVSSRALLLQSVSFLTPLYLGKNYAYRKRIVKHISKLHLEPPVNCQPSHWRKGS